jgi:ubiquinone/menaquinone biosynthesis C-methylase UbiE
MTEIIMDLLRRIGLQFKKPTGIPGKLVSNLMIMGNRSAYKTLIKELTPHSNGKILEIGYGPGIGIALISKRYESCDVYGIDFSELMFRRATNRNRQLIKNNRVHLILGDFIETEINTSGFNVIFCINVVYFWDDLQKPFERVRSLLKEDGLFCFYMASKEELNKVKFAKNDIFNKYSIEQITESLRSAGFGKVEYYYKNGFYIKAKK